MLFLVTGEHFPEVCCRGLTQRTHVSMYQGERNEEDIDQHVHSNYEIDLFEHLINDAARVLGVEASLENKSLRVIADHIRATAFLIVDGVTPSN